MSIKQLVNEREATVFSAVGASVAEWLLRALDCAMKVCGVNVFHNEHMTMLEQNPQRVIGYFQDRHVQYAA